MGNDLRKKLVFEHAYVLHRLGNNKDALKTLNSADESDKAELRFQFLSASINYKLYEYSKTANVYKNILQRNDQDIDTQDKSDIIVNLLACENCQSGSNLDSILKLIEQQQGYDKTYEYYFNLSQIYLKEGRSQEAFASLSEAQKLALKDDALKDDQVRFKVQEMHFLNELFAQYS